jgi:hypothetical protein
MGPPPFNNGQALRALFEHPEQWPETRANVDVLLYADHLLKKQFSDDELRAWLPRLKEWNIKFALEVGAIKEWGPTGAKCFAAQRPMWERIERCGGEIYAIAMDEPLLCVRKHLKEKQSDEYAVEETAVFIALVREHFPQILIGDIETYPSLSIEENIQWIEALNKRLAEKQVRGLDFYRLDVNWVEFTVFNRGSWPEVRKLEQYCRGRRLPFGLIYWASGYPALARRNLASDETWYVSLLGQGYDYALVQGRPDHYVLQSWIEAPAVTLPETAEFTFTRSVLDFTRKFVKPSP